MTFADRMLFRIKVLRAMAYVVMARLLVRFVPLVKWRDSIGVLLGAEQAFAMQVAPMQQSARIAVQSFVDQIDRACLRLPGNSRCLPRAVALGWLLRRRSMPLLTVIAFSKSDRTGDDAYHAWVECGGEMLIGHCDRSTYQPIMVLAAAPALGDATIANQRR